MADRPRRGTPGDERFFKQRLSRKGREILDKIPDSVFLHDISLTSSWSDSDYERVFRTKHPSESILVVFWEWTSQALTALRAYRDTGFSWNELFVRGYRWDLKGMYTVVADMTQLRDVLGQHGSSYKHHAVYSVRQ